jgi:zinc finger HIT domain-containing protein 1
MSTSKFVDIVPNSSASHGPNWTYTTLPPSQAHTNTLRTNGPRQQRAAKNLGFETSAAREGKIARHLLELEKDNYRDVQIPVAAKKVATGRGKCSAVFNGYVLTLEAVKGRKPTANVRRILASQKTFQNYLADEEALHGNAPPAAAVTHASRARRLSTYSAADSDLDLDDDDDESHSTAADTFHHEDLKGIEKSGGPPLGYNNAKVEPSIKPRRHFCEICGYWGNYKCLKCGVRYCSTECGAAHSETRCLKFYA